MTNRPPGGRAVRWRMPVSLQEVPNTLWIVCSWFQPFVIAGSDTPATMLYYKWEPEKVIGDNYKEFSAQHIICSPPMEWNDDHGCYAMRADTNRYINEELDKLRNDIQKARQPKAVTTLVAPPVTQPIESIPEDLKITRDEITLGMEVECRSSEAGKVWYSVAVIATLPNDYYKVRYLTATGKDFIIGIGNMRKAVTVRHRKKKQIASV
jgi:hypothetical protein